MLLKKSGLKVEQIASVTLAGGFGSYLDVQSAAAIGMLPAELAWKTRVLGNTSLAGARLALLDPEARGRLRDIQGACRYVELSGDRDFNEEYTDQLAFYEEDDDEWN